MASDTVTVEPRVPFACPGCGATDQWEANYMTPVHQPVKLVVGDDGSPDPADYLGYEENSGDPCPDDFYSCRCGYLVSPDGKPYRFEGQ